MPGFSARFTHYGQLGPCATLASSGSVRSKAPNLPLSVSFLVGGLDWWFGGQFPISPNRQSNKQQLGAV